MKINTIIIPLALSLSAAALHAEVVIDLKTGRITDTSTNPAPVRASGSTYNNTHTKVTLNRSTTCTVTPFEAVVEINMRPTATTEMKRAKFLVEYEGPGTTSATANIPSGWTTHLGDDPANDGFGGGTALDGVAEVQVLDQNLSLYSTGIAAGVVERIFYQELRLARSALRFEIANQYFAYGEPFHEVSSANTKKLFELPDSKGDYKLYAGFNRVIVNRTDRKGCGASKVIIELE